MKTPTAGGCYKRLPGGAVVPADQAPAPAPVKAKPARRRTTASNPLADTVPAATGDDTVPAATETATGGE